MEKLFTQKVAEEQLYKDCVYRRGKKYIVPTKVSYNKSEYQGDKVTDRVFILSMSETYEYFSSSDDMVAKATEYAIAKGAHISEATGDSVWWLRSPSGYSVSSYGEVNKYGNPLNDKTITVRPAMWVSLDDITEKTEEAK